MVQKKINIGFVIRDTNWHGGINYFRSLITAIMLKKNKNIKIFLFIPSNSDIKLFKDFKVKIIKTFFLNEKLFNRIINKLSFRMFKKNIFIEKIFNKYQINLLSHSNYTNLKDIKSMGYKPFIVGFVAMVTVGLVSIIAMQSFTKLFLS